jgi:predicted dehydrogenase
VHIPYLRSQPGAQVVGIYDANESRARETARFGIDNVSTSLAQLLEAHRPDLVHVLTPPQTHTSLAMPAMERPPASSSDYTRPARRPRSAGSRVCTSTPH